MKLLASDLVVRYSDDEGKITFLVPKSAEQLDELKRFYEFGQVSSLKKTKLGKELGIALVAFLEATHREDFKTADARNTHENSNKGARKARARKGPATFSNARRLLDRFDDSSSKQDVEAIAAILRDATAAGDKDAKQYLQAMWPKMSEVLMRRISRRRS